jgi:hypothetical protein
MYREPVAVFTSLTTRASAQGGEHDGGGGIGSGVSRRETASIWKAVQQLMDAFWHHEAASRLASSRRHEQIPVGHRARAIDLEGRPIDVPLATAAPGAEQRRRREAESLELAQ